MINLAILQLIFTVSQINIRHRFLTRFIGTKEEENQSHARANEVNLWFTLTTILCCVLEIILYFVYNRLVTFSESPIYNIFIFYLDPSLVADYQRRKRGVKGESGNEGAASTGRGGEASRGNPVRKSRG